MTLFNEGFVRIPVWVVFLLQAVLVTLSCTLRTNLLFITGLFFRCGAANWWSLTPGRATRGCTSVWAQTWWGRGTATPQSWWCMVGSWISFFFLSESNYKEGGPLKPPSSCRASCAGAEASEPGGHGGRDGRLPVRGPWRPRPHRPLAPRWRGASPREVSVTAANLTSRGSGDACASRTSLNQGGSFGGDKACIGLLTRCDPENTCAVIAD